jgi:hypothetical protein
MVHSSLFLVWHFQQQVTPTLATQRHLRSPAQFLRQTKPKPQHAMPKIPKCVGASRGFAIAVSSIARNPHLICAVPPTDTDTCPDFQQNPNAEPDEL